MKKTTKQLSLTVGITTCYGDISLLDTVKSVRDSKVAKKFEFIIIADRVKLSNEIKKGLKKYNVRFIENKKEAGQMDKHKQILTMTKTDILVLTQDDVLLDPKALQTVVNHFTTHPKTTMISIPYKPVKATSFFEEIINVGTHIANNTVKQWNKTDNYLASIGRFMAFRKSHMKKFRMPSLASSDNYYYFENKKMGGSFKYIPSVAVYFKNPQNMKEHLRKSSRFQHAQKEMFPYFGDLSKEYRVPKTAILKAFFEEFTKNPLNTILYFFIFAYTRILILRPREVLNPIWEVDTSTKGGLSRI